MKETCIPEIQNQDNQTVKQLRDQLLENNATIEQLNKTLVEIQQRRSRINIGT
jgi:TolA-binding protein